MRGSGSLKMSNSHVNIHSTSLSTRHLNSSAELLQSIAERNSLVSHFASPRLSGRKGGKPKFVNLSRLPKCSPEELRQSLGNVSKKPKTRPW